MSWLARGTAVMLTGSLGLAAASAPAASAPAASAPATATARHPATVRVSIRATGRDGSHGVIGEDAVAVSLSAASRGNMYRAGRTGVLTLPRGRYLLAVDITSAPVAPGNADSETLAARLLTVTRRVTVSFDARHGRRVAESLNKAGASALVASAVVCYGVGQAAQALVSGDVSAGAGQVPLYAIPFRYRGMSFGFATSWRDSAGKRYLTSGSRSGAIPARPGFAFSVARLARLTVRITSSAAPGGHGSLVVQQQDSCSPAVLTANPVRLPSRTSLYLSAGHWLASFTPSQAGQPGRQAAVLLRAGKQRTLRFAG